MKIQIKRFDKSLPMPEYKTKGAAALDLSSREEIKIKAGGVGYAPLNVAIKLPKNHWALIAARSSLHKEGLMMANGIGVGDSDYCGNDDEYRAALFNFSKKDVTVEKGQRIAQLLVLPVERMEIEEVEKLGAQNRGGFGSTGKK
jgi:dUTP pyrophosphatase